MLSLERFAEVRAEIERTGDRDAALAAAGLDAREWIRVQRHWLRELAGEITGGGTELAARYCRAFTGTSGASPAAEPAAPEAPAPAGPKHVPSYLAAPAVAPNVVVPAAAVSPAPPLAAPVPHTPYAAPPAPFAGTAMVFELPRGPAVPFREGAPAAAPSRVAPDRDIRPVQSGETALSFELPRGPATPFPAAPRAAPGAAPPAEARASASKSDPSAAFGSGTTLDTGLRAAGPSTPFVAPEAGPLGFTLQRYVELVAACQEPGAPREQVLSRFGLDTASFTDVDSAWKAKLRSEAGLTLEFHRRLNEETTALADRRRENAERPKRAGATAAIPVHTPAPAAAQPATGAPEPPMLQPVAGAPPPAAPAPSAELTVEQYAWVVATLRKAASPAELEQALARFRLTAETRKQLEDRWRARMAANPGLQGRFLALLAGHLRGPGT